MRRAAAIAEMAFVGALLIVSVGMSLRMLAQLVIALFSGSAGALIVGHHASPHSLTTTHKRSRPRLRQARYGGRAARDGWERRQHCALRCIPNRTAPRPPQVKSPARRTTTRRRNSLSKGWRWEAGTAGPLPQRNGSRFPHRSRRQALRV